MPPKQAISESAAKKSKKRNVVLVTEDYESSSSRLTPINEPFEVDQDDLRVVDELIRTQREMVREMARNGYIEDPDSVDIRRIWDMRRKNIILDIGDGKDKRITKIGDCLALVAETLPTCIAQLDALKILDISNAFNITTIPEWIGNLKNLKELTLPESSKVTELPDAMFNLDKLEHFSFGPHPLNGGDAGIAIPDLIGKLRKLKNLRLSSVNFLPQELENLTLLEDLSLDNYEVKFFPTSIGKLYNLERLYIYEALILRSLPQSIGQLKNLKELYLDSTEKLRSLPESIGNLENLELLRICISDLQSLPSSIGNLRKLKYLTANHTEKLTRLPDSIGNLTMLKSLVLSHTGILSLPETVYNLRNLEVLELSCASITELSNAIYKLRNLKFLGLDRNKIKKLPDFNKLEKLRHLGLESILFNYDDDCASLEKVAAKYPLVTCFGEYKWENAPDHTALFYRLFSRRVKRNVLAIMGRDSCLPLSIWPLILAQHPKKYRDEASDGVFNLECNCCCSSYVCGGAPKRSDVQFQLLKEFGHKFLSSSSR